jgi:DNA helicase II / ATP-dependent DNA helicase PcrA
MDMRENPNYAEEKAHLEEIVQYLEAQLAVPVEGYGANEWASVVLEGMNRKARRELEDIRAKPYFGRVDWLKHGKAACEVLYVGPKRLSNTQVYSWADNLAGDLYYGRETGREVGSLLLKRTFEIAKDDLKSIRDEYINDQADSILTAEFSDTLLYQLLQEDRKGQLHDIIATIQAQQYRIIRLPYEQILIIQGVPGSGKTSVALYRVAYLLYHYRKKLKKIQILAPSSMFLGYIANVLPSIGEQGIPQMTFEAWMFQKLGAAVTVEPGRT